MGLCRLFIVTLLVVLAHPAAGQDVAPPVPPVDKDPVLRLEGRGPLSPIHAVGFGADGATLYEAGWDKIVRVWRRDARTGQFSLDAASTLRIPIGPGDSGVLNALAVSADGAWLAAGGNAVSPEDAGFRQAGLMLPQDSVADPLAQGVIYVFNLRANPPSCLQLRGHRGPVWALAFAATPPGRRPNLLSAGEEPDPRDPKHRRLVLRLWDVAGRAELDRAACGELRGMRPWLAAWSVAPDHGRIRAAAAWTDSSFLVWDAGVAQPKLVSDPHSRENDRGRSTVLSYLSGRGMILTGHFGVPPRGQSPEGFLDSWDANATAPVWTGSQVVSWADGRPSSPDVKAMPVAQAPVCSRPGGPQDLLAVVAQSWHPQDTSMSPMEYRLQLLDLTPERFGSVRAQSALWSAPRTQPFIASSPDGGRMAIVGNPENEILVHSVADLLQGRPDPQRLRGVGEPVKTATFVRKGADDWGLRIGRASGAGQDDLVFDLTNRTFSPPSVGWTVAEAGSGDWRTALVPPARRDGPRGRPLFWPWYLWVYHRKQVIGPGIPVRPDRQDARPEDIRVTAHALLPPGRAPVPIAAIAAYEPMVGPILSLYNAMTGERFRQLSGHTGTIRSLAFSQDGRLLVSAADDRTICVWSLIDLDRILRTRGALPGLVLTGRGGRYVVSNILQGSPLPEQADLRAGDVIEGYVDGRVLLHALSSALDLHFMMASRPPGQAVTLRRRRDGQGAQDISVVLGQAVDERKPLLTLFLARGGPERPLEWLGWNPFGPYDSSGPGIASLFGWHFNAPDRPEAPARFALATGYPMFRREGLLRDLIREGRLPPPPDPHPLKPADMHLFLDPIDQAHGDLTLVREPPTLLSLELDDRVPPERIGSVRWRFDRDEFRAMRADERTWTADLSGIRWDREAHELTVEVRVRDPDAQPFLMRQKVRYIPKPPRLRPAAALAAGRLDVKERRFHFEADVEPASGEQARARLVCRHGDGKPLLDVIYNGPDFARRPRVDATIELKPGDNMIELEVVNAGARVDLRDEETTRFGPVTVHYSPRPVERPFIRVESLELLSEDTGAPSGMVKVRGSEPCIVETTTRVRIRGRITVKEKKDKLQLAEWRAAGQSWKGLTGFDARRSGEAFDIAEDLDLLPDRQVIEFRARAVNGDAEEETSIEPLVVVCHPPLPGLDLLQVDNPGPIVEPGTGGDGPKLRLTAQIKGEPGRIDKALATRDGDEIAGLEVDRESRRISGLVRLHRGTNAIGVLLSNRWHSVAFGPIRVEYRRPPLVERWQASLLPGRPFAGISARVASLTALTRAEIEVLPQAGNAEPPNSARWERRAEGVWEALAEVPIRQGANEVTLRTWNQDGESTPPKPVRLVYQKPVEPKPDLNVAESEKTVGRPIAPLRFVVRSTSPLTRVELIFKGPPPRAIKRFDIERLRRGPDGTYVFREDGTIHLEPGQNSFRIEAVNAGGMSTAELALTYTPPPVRVVIDKVTGGGKTLRPEGRAEGPPTIPERLPHSGVSLRGRVIWADAPSMLASADLRLQVWVNGFPHVAVTPEGALADRPLERRFQADLLLSRLEDNEIDLRLDGKPLDDLGENRLLVSCQKVEPDWRLHLLVIGIGAADEQELRRRALEALNGCDFNEGDRTFKTPAFPVAKLYGPLCPVVFPANLYGRLRQIRRAIAMGSKPSNEIVILYYQGGEIVEKKEGPCLRLRPGGSVEGSAIFQLSEIRKELIKTRGAKLFLLDVTRAPDRVPLILSRAAQWVEDESSYGLLRLSWQEQPAPPEGSLADALREILREHNRITLEEISSEVERRSRLLMSRYPSLRYLPELTRHFNGLVFGGP